MPSYILAALLALLLPLAAASAETPQTAPATVTAASVDSAALDLTRAVTTASGLRYVDETAGQGESPKYGEIAQIRYTGWLFDNGRKGDEFDSNAHKGGKILSFPVGRHRAIPAWDEAVSSMRPGGRRLLIVPPDLGYGDRGAGDAVPPGATLVFELELVAVKPAPARPDLDHPI